MALEYPFGKYVDPADKVALKYLARSSEKWLNVKLSGDQITSLNIIKIKEDKIKFINNRMFKEIYNNRDTLEADSIVNNFDNNNNKIMIIR